MQSLPLRSLGVSDLAEAERRLLEISVLIERQRQLIKELELDGHDLTSAQIVLDSLLISRSLYVQARYRVRCYVEPKRPEMVAIASTRNSGCGKTCDKCGDTLSAPEWSENVGKRRVFNLWSCAKCGTSFGEIAISLPACAESIDDMRNDDIIRPPLVA
jgi:hypothetical protein